MRAAILLALLAACPGGTGDECTLDSDCGGGLACARTSECLPTNEVRSSRITWTVNGLPANPGNCSRTPNLYLLFSSTQVNDVFGYEPVPCQSGLFTVDKLPRRFISVEIGKENGGPGDFHDSKPLDTQGNATFDLVP